MSINYDTLTDRELLIVLATKLESLELNVLGHIPQDCIAHQARIFALEQAFVGVRDEMETKAAKSELKEVKDSTTWAFRIAAGAVLAAMFDIGRWILTSVIGKAQ